MQKIFLTSLFVFTLTSIFGQTTFQKDFLFYWQTIKDNFAYFDRQHTDWDKVKEIYEPALDTVKGKNDLIGLLERMNNELYNGHVFLNANTNSSNRIIPSGADMVASRINDRFVITSIREGFNADLCGLRTGMFIVKYNGIRIDEAIKIFLPKSVSVFDNDMYDYAVNMVLAGTHHTKREITIEKNGQEQIFYPDRIPNKTEENYITLLESRILPDSIGYIKINNSLGNSDLIESFDKILDSLMFTKGLILDLRETPGGGTTTVARAIMGRFISEELAYQKHIYTVEQKESGIRRSTLELVTPRHAIYKKPIIILVGYWTSSMGEGIAIGFDGMCRAKVAGTKMAGLLGEIYSFETPELKIPFSFPCVQLQHINGQPRENFMPSIIVDEQSQILKIASALLTKSIKK